MNVSELAYTRWSVAIRPLAVLDDEVIGGVGEGARVPGREMCSTRARKSLQAMCCCSSINSNYGGGGREELVRNFSSRPLNRFQQRGDGR